MDFASVAILVCAFGLTRNSSSSSIEMGRSLYSDEVRETLVRRATTFDRDS